MDERDFERAQRLGQDLRFGDEPDARRELACALHDRDAFQIIQQANAVAGPGARETVAVGGDGDVRLVDNYNGIREFVGRLAFNPVMGGAGNYYEQPPYPNQGWNPGYNQGWNPGYNEGYNPGWNQPPIVEQPPVVVEPPPVYGQYPGAVLGETLGGAIIGAVIGNAIMGDRDRR